MMFMKDQTDGTRRINVNDPQLISLVNKLQDVFATVGVCNARPHVEMRT